MLELRIRLSPTRPDGRSASTSSTRPPTEDAARIRKSAGSRTASWRQPSSGSRCSRTAGTSGREQAEGGRHPRGAVRALGRGQIGEHRPEAGETGVVESGVLTETGGRVAKVIEEIEETDAAKSGAQVATDDRVARMSEHLEHQAAGGSHDQNGLTSEGFQEQEPSEQLTAEKRPAQAVGMLLEDREPSERYRPRAATGTESPIATADRMSRSVATVER